MPALQPVDIYRYALQAGFSPDQAVTMTAIGLAESGGNLAAHNPEGEDSRGIWQVNLEAHPQYAGLDVHDPLVNAQMAYEVSVQGTDIRPWTVTHADNPHGARYLQYREAAEEAARLAGYPDAQGQWNPPGGYGSAVVGAGPGGGAPPPELSPPEPEVDADAAAAAAADSTDVDEPPGPDSSGDGLLDEYKAMMGLDANATDTDQDGFGDAYEVQYGTDARDYFSNPLAGTSQEPGGEAPPLTTELPPDPETEAPAPSPADTVGSQAPPGGVQTAVAGTSSVQVADDPVQATQDVAALDPETGVPEGTELDTFLDAALSQQGASYIFGAPDEDPNDPNPMSDGVAAYDCSSFIKWAAARAGIDFTDGSWYQYLDIQEAETELTVEEALQTPGALLFNFSEEPTAGGGRPSQAHVAISLGNGQTIEARGSKYGVGSFETDGREFSHAGWIPDIDQELTEELMTTYEGDLLTEPLPLLEESLVDSSGDGLLDEYKTLLGLDAFSTDSDSDGFLDSYELQYGTDPLAAESTPLVGEPGDEVPAVDDEGELIPEGVDDDQPGPDDDLDTGAVTGDGGDDAVGGDDIDDGDADVDV